MLILDSPAELPDALKGAAFAVGNFDGVHRGHQELLRVTASEAKRSGRLWGVVTFEPHPRSFFKPSEPVFRLTPLALKARLLKALGASFLVVLAFDREFSSLEPEQFAERHLVARIAASHVVTGYDFHFGKGRKGNPQTMRELGAKLGFSVTIVDQVTDEGDIHSPFSSSSIRSALRHGHVADAGHELGYNWTVMGEVVHGDRRGRTIGFPTLNMVLNPGAEPYRGIYAVRVRDAKVPGSVVWLGAGYFGDRPTFDTERTFLEVHLLDFDSDLYGRTLLVEFAALIRPDRRFESVEALVNQMNQDCVRARELLAENNPLTEYPLGKLQARGLL